jgi:predicted Zn-dependent peptidase
VAITLGEYAVYFNAPDLINTIFYDYIAITAEQVKQVAQKYLVASGRAVVTTLPTNSQAKSAAGR